MIFGNTIGGFDSRGVIGAGFDDGALDDYHDHFGALNPWMHMNMAMKPGDVGVSDQALDRRDLFKTEFYNDWMRPAGDLLTGAAMICQKSDEHLVGMALACPARHADTMLSPVHGLMQALSPHVTQVIDMSRAIGGESIATAGKIIDTSRHAMFLIARSGRVVHVNSPGTTLLRAGGDLAVSADGRLRSGNLALQNGLQRAVMALQCAQPRMLPAPIGFASARFGQCVMHCHPIQEDQMPGFPGNLWSDPVVGMVVVAGPAGLSDVADIGALARGLGATAAEAELAASLCRGVSVGRYADERGLSRHTVRNQVRAMLHKCGARNQADLVQRLLRLSSPFT